MAKEFKYRDIVKSPEYRKLLLTNLMNRFGDSVDAIAFTWLVYEITSSASWSALIEKLLHGTLDHLSILSPEKDYIGRRNRTLILLDYIRKVIKSDMSAVNLDPANRYSCSRYIYPKLERHAMHNMVARLIVKYFFNSFLFI